MALMESAARWPSRNEGLIGVVSVDHGTRPEAASEADYVAARARVLGFDAQIVRVFAHKTDEASLRHARYDALARVLSASGAETICTAHHRDDDAEGFVMDLFGWGGGREGAAMSVRSSIGEHRLVRPFVGLGREELRVALGSMGVKQWVVDPSDVRIAGKRAFVRHQIMPQLERFSEQIPSRLAQRAARIHEQEQYFASIGLRCCERRGPGFFAPRRAPEDAALVRREVQEILRQLSQGDPRRARPTIDRLLEAAGYRDGRVQAGVSFDLPGCQATVMPEGVLFIPRTKEG